jgi:potassium-transporting ATPase KdpC subunit
MASTLLPGPVRQFGVAARAVAVFTLALGIAYPVAMTGAGQALFNDNANGSLVQVDGKDVGSDLIGQPYTRQVTENGQPKVDEEGEPVMEADPQWFQTRPSAVDYDGLGSSASQLGPNNEDLVAAIQQRRTTVAALEGVRPEDVPADALTASGSGLDPQISPEYAAIQVNRVARERGLDAGRLHELVDQHTKGRVLGFLGEPRVNVVELNAELAGMG